MSAIGKVQASLSAASQETTLALANLNFDFSLVKVEAPREYQQLGIALAKERRSAAESGPAHQTARRLGSLFQSILPDTPNLVRAYGERASEIAQCPEVNPKGTKDDGPFQRYIGADGTTIWAAATSGTAAIAAHLLACMLAVHWPASEAVAIWVELVNERKKRLAATTANDTFRIDDAVASLTSVDQTQLAMWDASARSWLKAAEDAPMVKTRQNNVRSILVDMNATVNGKEDLYTSVLDAWVLTMETFESIVSGSSFSIQDGAIVLGLLSWHLYPDVLVLGKTSRELQQDDSLISPGGLVTIGLTSHRASERDPSGIHWSLSLAHLTYYGTPQAVKRSTGPNDVENNRLTLDEFTLVLLGAFAGLWGDDEPISIPSAIDVIGLIVSELKRGLDDPVMKKEILQPQRYDFVEHFAAAVARYQRSDNEESNMMNKLVELGFRYKDFFKLRSRETFRSFGLDGIPLGALLGRQEDRLAYYRSIAARLVTAPQQDYEINTRCLLLILDEGKKEQKAFFYCKNITRPTDRRSLGALDDVDEVRVGLKSYALQPAQGDKGGKAGKGGKGGKRINIVDKKVSGLTWRHTPAWIKSVLIRCGVLRVASPFSSSLEWVFDCIHTTSDHEFLLFRGRPNAPQYPRGPIPAPLNYNHGSHDPGFIQIRGPGGGPPPPPPRMTGPPPPPFIQAGVSVPPPGAGLPRKPGLNFAHTYDEIKAAFKSGRVSPVQLSTHLHSTEFSWSVLAKLSFFFRLYNGLAGATISPGILASKSCRFWDLLRNVLGNRRGVGPIQRRDQTSRRGSIDSPVSGYNSRSRSSSPQSPLSFDSIPDQWADGVELDTAFRTIATLEMGQNLFLDANQNASQMAQVFAISVDDSLYLATPLLCDPMVGFSSPPEIRRVRGNVSRPGLTLLGLFSSPDRIEVRDKDPSLWRVINHHEYDGTLEDCFESTSLHIRLTGYIQDVARNGSSRFAGASFAEAVVSCHDGGKWVADIDAMYSRSRYPYPGQFDLIRPQGRCRGFYKTGQPLDTRILTVENWEELLDPPAEPVVFKSHGNWQARLAASAICLQKGYNALLFGHHGCWDCAFDELYRLAPNVQLLPARRRHGSSRHADVEDDDEKAWAESLVASIGGSRVMGHGLGIDEKTREPVFMEEDVDSASETASQRRVDDITTPSISPKTKPKDNVDPQWLSLSELDIIEEEEKSFSERSGASSPTREGQGGGRSVPFGAPTQLSRSSKKEVENTPLVFIL